MFPALLSDDSLAAKDYVFVLRAGGDQAWPLADFEGGAVVNDRVGVLDVVLVGNAGTRTVRAYRSDGLAFEADPRAGDRLLAGGQAWRVTEDALVGPDGRTLPRLPGHIAYWFAWAGFSAP
jgi:hypothetical protein